MIFGSVTSVPNLKVWRRSKILFSQINEYSFFQTSKIIFRIVRTVLAIDYRSLVYEMMYTFTWVYEHTVYLLFVHPQANFSDTFFSKNPPPRACGPTRPRTARKQCGVFFNLKTESVDHTILQQKRKSLFVSLIDNSSLTHSWWQIRFVSLYTRL